MSDLFAPTSIGPLSLRNRFVRSATWEGMAGTDGSVTRRLAELLADLARGEVGLIISGHTYVSPEGQAGLKQMGAHTDDMIPGLSMLADAVHGAGGKIVLQLAHAGGAANTALTGLPTVGPSLNAEPPCCELTPQGIADVAAAFARAALRAQSAGFDGVQVHCAHGYLLSQFLSPAWNRRQDEYGGPIENRARAALEVVAAVRAVVGPDYPVLAKINSEDFVENGVTREDSARVAALLQGEGVDAVELSGGCRPAGEAFMPARKGRIRSRADEVYYRQAATLCKENLDIPLILVGGVRSIETAEDLVEQDVADFIALSRPLICEPGLVKRWREGDRRPAECVSDNACYGPAFAGEGIRCVTFQKKRAKLAG